MAVIYIYDVVILVLILHCENVCRNIIILSECEAEMQNGFEIIPT